MKRLMLQAMPVLLFAVIFCSQDAQANWEDTISVSMLGPGNVEEVRDLTRFRNDYPLTWPAFLKLPAYTYLTTPTIVTRQSEIAPGISSDKVYGAAFMSESEFLQSIDAQLTKEGGFEKSSDSSSLGPIYIYESNDYRISIHYMEVYSKSVLSVFTLSVRHSTPKT